MHPVARVLQGLTPLCSTNNTTLCAYMSKSWSDSVVQFEEVPEAKPKPKEEPKVRLMGR